MKRWILRLLLCVMILLLAGSSFVLAEDELPKLGTATELIWGRSCYKNTVDGPTIWQESPGCASWKPAELDLSKYKVTTYNEQNDIISTFWVTRGTDEFECDYVSNAVFHWVDDLPSGKYYFTVQALGDGETYADGDIVRSDFYDYIRPEQSCAAIDDVHWDGTTVYWTDVKGTEGFDYYKYELYREDTMTETPKNRIAYGLGLIDDHAKDYSSKMTIPGYYYFRVCVHTNDMTQYAEGPWASPSAPYFVGDTASDENNYVKADFNHTASDLSVISTIVPLSEPVTLLAATYDDNGRFLGFDMKQVESSETEQTISLAPEKQNAKEVKLFVMDDDLEPVDEALKASF